MKSLTALAVSSFALVSLFSVSANAASGAGTASVIIKTPISIAETTAMNVGTVIPTNAAASATVVLDFANAASSSNATITGATSGVFTVSGAGTSSFALSTLGTVTLTDQDGNSGADMIMTLSSSPAAGSLALVSGSLPITIGGSLAVGANQVSSGYQGTYNVTVDYN